LAAKKLGLYPENELNAVLEHLTTAPASP
jgi:hypothetical protein